MSSFSDSSSDDDGDYIEEPYEDDSLDMICLFCDHKESPIDSLLHHIHSAHGLNLKEFCSTNKFDSIMYIKFINYVRSHKIPASEVQEVIKKSDWENEQYIRCPVIQNDALLTIDLCDSDDERERDGFLCNSAAAHDSGDQINNVEDDAVSLARKLSQAESEIERLRELLFQLGCDDDNNGPSSQQNPTEDNFYSWSYSHHGIHHEMLSDRVRTESYKNAIMNNKSLIEGKLCLDVGCGTGILSLFAISAGASKVIAVDQSDIIYTAMDISEENSVSRKIDFKKGKLESLNLGTKFDVIISEWMGYFLLFEGMLDTIIHARDKYLKPGGVIMPGKCTMFMAAVCDESFHREKIAFWDNVYGYRMTSIKKEVLHEVQVEPVRGDHIISSSFPLKHFDLLTCTLKEVQKVDQEFELNINANGSVHALVVWFDCLFDLASPIVLSTSPCSELTHWKQSVLFLDEPVAVTRGDKLKGRIVISRTSDNFRSLRIKLGLEGQKLRKFTLM